MIEMSTDIKYRNSYFRIRYSMVVKNCHHGDMNPQLRWVFCCTPSFAKQPVNITPELGKGVIDAEDRIKFQLLELSLSRDGSSASFNRYMGAERKMSSNIRRVVRIIVRLYLGKWMN